MTWGLRCSWLLGGTQKQDDYSSHCLEEEGSGRGAAIVTITGREGGANPGERGRGDSCSYYYERERGLHSRTSE
jgi:hypothetical protein